MGGLVLELVEDHVLEIPPLEELAAELVKTKFAVLTTLDVLLNSRTITIYRDNTTLRESVGVPARAASASRT